MQSVNACKNLLESSWIFFKFFFFKCTQFTIHMYERICMQVAIITPFNFPLEIPLLQLMGALYMGNKPILKVDSKV
jgi:delta 1-pyrroline-5-carboxylate dehydrogenase